jgi:hypothetical protein
VNKFEEFKKSLEPYTLEHAEQVTGIPVATLSTVANEIAASGTASASVGDGRDAALRRVGHVDGDLEPAAADGELHAPGDGGVSAARA